MGITNLLKDKREEIQGTTSLSRSVALGTFLILSAGFVVNAWQKALAWEVYIAYPMGVALAFAPALFLRLLNGVKDVIQCWKFGGGADR